MSHYVARYSQNNYYRKRVPISPAPMTELFGDKKILRIFFSNQIHFFNFLQNLGLSEFWRNSFFRRSNRPLVLTKILY